MSCILFLDTLTLGHPLVYFLFLSNLSAIMVPNGSPLCPGLSCQSQRCKTPSSMVSRPCAGQYHCAQPLLSSHSSIHLIPSKCTTIVLLPSILLPLLRPIFLLSPPPFGCHFLLTNFSFIQQVLIKYFCFAIPQYLIVLNHGAPHCKVS